MFSDRILVVLTSILFLTGAGTIGYVFFGEDVIKFTNEFNFKVGKTDCVEQRVSLTMDDEFMTGLVDKGSRYLVLKNYYACNSVKRGDIVSFRISAPLQPVVKVIRAVGGDKFEVIPDKENLRRYFLKVNGEFVPDRTGRFILESPGKPALETYQEARSGKLRDDEVLILSNVSPGKSDSASLGLVKSRMIEGKVILQN